MGQKEKESEEEGEREKVMKTMVKLMKLFLQINIIPKVATA